MAERKKDIEQLWGVAARAEVDAEVPVTVLKKTLGKAPLHVEHMSHVNTRTVEMSLTQFNPYGYLQATLPITLGVPTIVRTVMELAESPSAHGRVMKGVRGMTVENAVGVFGSK
jgi:hypothetical protein